MAEEKKAKAPAKAAEKKAPAKKAPAKKPDAPKKPAEAKKPAEDKKPAAKSSGAKKADAKKNVEVEIKKSRAVGAKKAAEAKPSPAVIGDIAPKVAAKKAETPKEKQPKGKDAKGRAYATGKRKTSIARVWLAAGKGKIVVNGKDFEAYFRRPVLQLLIVQPFQVAGREKAYDVNATLKGGGLSGQAGALKHGISRALVLFEPELRPAIKAAGLLTRDSRIVERKHYGHKKARRSFQFSKR